VIATSKAIQTTCYFANITLVVLYNIPKKNHPNYKKSEKSRRRGWLVCYNLRNLFAAVLFRSLW